MLLQLGRQFLLGFGVLGFAGKIDDLARIFGDMVELLGGAFGKGEVLEALEARLVLVVHEQALGG